MKNILTKEMTRRRSFLIFSVGALLLPIASQIYDILLGSDGFESLYTVSGYWFYLCAALTVVVYICLSSSMLEDVDETISGCKGKGYYQRKGLERFLIVFILSQAIIFLMMQVTVVLDDPTDYAHTVLPKMFFCNLFLPMLVCLLVACVLAQWDNQQASAIALIVFLVMSSPVTEMMLGNEEDAGSMGTKLGYALRHCFGIFYEESIWSPNGQIGLQTEWTRFAVQFFWILLCLGLLCLMKTQKKQILGCLLLACSIACMVYAQLPANTYRHYNNNIDQYLYRDEVVSLQKEADIGYTIAAYDLTLDFNRQLDVTGELVLQAEQPTDAFVLTLYRGYQMKNITSTQPMTWSVQDDCITVKTEKPTEELKLALHYTGYNAFLYSNMDGAMLPGWFPWYPMAGERQIYVDFGRQGSEYNTYNRIEPTHIRLTVQAPFTCVSNLSKTSEQIYEGESDSITVIGGYITQTDDPVVMNLLPLESTATEEQNIKEKKETYQKLCDTMESYGLDKTLISDRKIILTSYDLECNGAGGGTAIFSDYILTTSSGLNFFSSFTSELILERNQSELAFLIGGMGLAETPAETLESWSFFADIPREEMSDVQKQLADLLHSAKDAGKGEQLVQDIAVFLFSEHNAEDEEAFWKELNIRYGKAE